MALTIELGGPGMGEMRLTSDAVWEIVASLHVLAYPHEYLLHTRLRGWFRRGRASTWSC